MKRILVLGVNGFIGHHLVARILADTDWEVHGMDMYSSSLEGLLDHPRFHFFEGDITINREWIAYHIKKCDVILPLVAIATPATYVREPLRVFELDFEANLPIVRAAVTYGKRLVFPSTSEVYGMSPSPAFDPETSELVYGPICKQRWIYACSKQLMDRVIYAYGYERGLDFTLFRPFNWIGAGLDSIDAAKEGSSRVLTQFLGHIVRGENIKLVDGGGQKRSFTFIDDGIDALMAIIHNADGIVSGKIYNIGNPDNNISVRELAQRMLEMASRYPEYAEAAACVKLEDCAASDYYGAGYQDVQNRVPDIATTRADLRWTPRTSMETALQRIFDAYREHVREAQQLLGSMDHKDRRAIERRRSP
ncbi:MAG: bifunctional UDP-4-keto-pentose/UDP-xylose synthase [Steroidobacteraceae bacterium]